MVLLLPFRPIMVGGWRLPLRVDALRLPFDITLAAGLLYQLLILVVVLPGLILYALRGTLPTTAQVPGE